MLGKCGNELCSARFRYLHDGKLFALPVGPASGNGHHKLELFWLCGRCAPQMTLRVGSGHRVIAIPLSAAEGERRSAE